jgi:hypothetical protein
MGSSHLHEGAPLDEDSHILSADVRPARRLMRLAQDFICDIFADGLSLEGRILNLNEQGLAVALSEPGFADLNCVQVILTAHDGSLCHLTGRVVRQHQTTIGEVVVGIQLAELSVETTTDLIEKCAPHSPFTMEPDIFRYPESSGLHGWIHALIGQPPVPPPDHRRIPRLPIHTACVVLRPEMTHNGLTQDLSYSGLAVLFPNISPGQLWGAVLQVKFVRLKALPVSIEHRGPDVLVRFRVDDEGKDRWRELHYSYWRHLS